MSEKEATQSRLTSVVYLLIYPAYMGNMVYDVVQMILSLTKLHVVDVGSLYVSPLSCLACILIMLFNIVEYTHLFADVNPMVEGKVLPFRYWVCDLLTPNLFFAAFICTKYNLADQSNPVLYPIAAILIGIVPVIVFWYKSLNTEIKAYCLFEGISIVYLLISCISIWLTNHFIIKNHEVWLVGYIAIGLVAYLVFVAKYRGKYKDSDLQFYSTLPSK